MKAAVRRQLENTTEIMETDEKLTMSVHHVKVTVSQWREVTEVTGQCFPVRVHCERRLAASLLISSLIASGVNCVSWKTIQLLVSVQQAVGQTPLRKTSLLLF